jgi:hypothetical protein
MPQPSPPAAAGRLPGNLDQALFLIAALAFCSLSSLALLTDYMGSDLAAGHLADWAITGLAYGGAAVSWYLASQRAACEEKVGPVAQSLAATDRPAREPVARKSLALVA